MIYVDTSYLIIRGAGNNPSAGGTKVVFRPDADTKYDTLVNDRVSLVLDEFELRTDRITVGSRQHGVQLGLFG